MPAAFWRVYNYLALQWYETEYGRGGHWYIDAMTFMEDLSIMRTRGTR